MSRFYEYRQNNSGGYFEGDFITILIEADSSLEANEKASGCGVDFDASYCECCGKRWSEAWEEDYVDLEEFKKEYHDKTKICYKDGNVEILESNWGEL